MNIRLFSPENIKPEDYKHRYPELDRTTEFADLSPRALVFVWYYSNQTSPLVDIRDDYERTEEALKKSGYNPGKVEKEAILKLQFSSDMAAAIKKMSEYSPSERFKAYKMIRTIFDHYEKLIKDGPEAFTVTEGKGENQMSYIDHSRYVNTSAKIVEEILILLVKLEEGFGVIDIKGEAKEEDEVMSIRDWHKKREHVNE
jgi:hypothetical protein